MVFDDRLDKILSQYANEVHNLPTFDEYTQKFKVAKIAESKQSIISKTHTQLRGLFDKTTKEVLELNGKIAKIKAPNLNNPDPMMKVFGAVEYNSALMVIQNKPPNIETILTDAVNEGRIEFALQVANGILQSTTNENYKRNINFIMEAIYETTGIKALENQIKETGMFLYDVEKYLKLIEDDPVKFESEVSTKERVVNIMHENGQFEGESVFLKKA